MERGAKDGMERENSETEKEKGNGEQLNDSDVEVVGVEKVHNDTDKDSVGFVPVQEDIEEIKQRNYSAVTEDVWMEAIKPLEIGRCEGKSSEGLGLFAIVDIEAHQYASVCEYWAPLGMKDDMYINHQCRRASCCFEEIARNGGLEVCQWIKTLRDVKADEELTLHYNIKKATLSKAFGGQCEFVVLKRTMNHHQNQIIEVAIAGIADVVMGSPHIDWMCHHFLWPGTGLCIAGFRDTIAKMDLHARLETMPRSSKRSRLKRADSALSLFASLLRVDSLGKRQLKALEHGLCSATTLHSLRADDVADRFKRAQ
eukprot:2101472-Rhodomonas_salina.1